MVCRIDLIDDVETIENFKRMQRDQWAEYRGPFRYLWLLWRYLLVSVIVPPPELRRPRWMLQSFRNGRAGSRN
jgi:hypothetical protein